MSIAGDIEAERADKKRMEWVAALDAAYAVKDWVAVKRLLDEMRAYQF